MGHINLPIFIFELQGEYAPFVIISISPFLTADFPTILEPSFSNIFIFCISAEFKFFENTADVPE